MPTAANTAHCSHGGVATAHSSHAIAATPLRAAPSDHAPAICHATGTHPSTDASASASRLPITIKIIVGTHGFTVITGSCLHTSHSSAAMAAPHSTARRHTGRGSTGASSNGPWAADTNICTDSASSPSFRRTVLRHTRLPTSPYAISSDHASNAATHGRGQFSGDHDRKTSAASINVATGSTTRMWVEPHAMDIRRTRSSRVVLCVALVLAVARGQPYGELLDTLMQAEPTQRFEQFCTAWSNARWVQNVTATLNSGTLKTCDGLYTKTSAADAVPQLLAARPATGPDRPPGVFSNVRTAATGGTTETVISVCSQVAASVTEGTPNIGQCPDTHPFPNGESCCATDGAGNDLSGCVECTTQSCSEPRACPSGTVDGDLTISTVLEQWFPTQFNDVVLAAQLYNPAAGFSAANTKVALVPNLDLGTGTRAFYAAMSDTDRLKRLCFSETPLFGASHQPPQPPPWTLALAFLGEPVPGQLVERAVGPPVTMVHDGAQVVAPDSHVVVSSAAVAFAWVLGASAELRNNGDIECEDAGAQAPNSQQAALDLAQSDADTVHAWRLINETVRVGLPFASAAACLDVVDGVPSVDDMRMLCDVSAPDCVAVAFRSAKACLIVAEQTADGISTPYKHDDTIEQPPDAVFTSYLVRDPVVRDLAQMNGVAALGTTGDAAVAAATGHTVDSCRALCWGDPGCTAWTLDGTDCRTVGLDQTQPVVTQDGLNLTCLEKLGFDVGTSSGQCSDLPLDYAFSTHHDKCVHIRDLLMQPWCPEPWTTAAQPLPGNNIQDVPELSLAGAAFASFPRTTCVCGTNEHVVGASSPDGRTGVRCHGTQAVVRHPGTYSQQHYTAFRLFHETRSVRELETFPCAVAETCIDEAAARCEVVANCSGAVVDGSTATVRVLAGVIKTAFTLRQTAGKSPEEKAADSALAQRLPLPTQAPDKIFMVRNGRGPLNSLVQVGTTCTVDHMRFVTATGQPNLVCLGGSWVEQTVDNSDKLRHGAVNCDKTALGDTVDRKRFECVDRPLLATGGAPNLGDTLVADHANEDFVGAAPVAHRDDIAALYVGGVEQCVNPEYLGRMGPVVRTQQQGCNVVEVGGGEKWKDIQAQHPSMLREVMQQTGCMETDLHLASQVPSGVASTMADLFDYALQVCNRALTMHGTATLGEFLEDGGELLGDVYQQAGCTGNFGGSGNLQNPLPLGVGSPPFFLESEPMTKYFGDAHAWCTLDDEVHRTGCCGSPDCTPPRCKTLTGSLPLPRCRVTSLHSQNYFDRSKISMEIGPSVHPNFPASNCNDGNVNNFCSSNLPLSSPAHLTVDLGSTQTIEAVEIYNRKDCCQERFGDHVIELSNDKSTFTQCFSGKLPSTVGPHVETCRGTARFVRLQMLSSNGLNLAEVKVQVAPRCNKLSSWRRVAPTGGAVQTGPSNAGTCTEVNVGRGASNVAKATPTDPGCNEEYPTMHEFGNTGLFYCYQGEFPFSANINCQCTCSTGLGPDGTGRCDAGPNMCQDTVPCPGQAAVLPIGLPDYAVPYPEMLGNQIVAAAPKGYECARPGSETPTFDGTMLEDNKGLDVNNMNCQELSDTFHIQAGTSYGCATNANLGKTTWDALNALPCTTNSECSAVGATCRTNENPSKCVCFTVPTNLATPCPNFNLNAVVGQTTIESAWTAAGCFNTRGIPQQEHANLGSLLGEMRATCLEAQQGIASAEVACCGRVGCGAVLSCPVIDPLVLPLPVCSNNVVAHRAGSGFACRAGAVVSGVLCKHVCSMQQTSNCIGKTAVDIDGVGCMLVPQQQCTQAIKWDDPDAFPCAAGVDTQGRACIGAPDPVTKTCTVRSQGSSSTVNGACPDHVADVRHTPWAFEQQPGACASTVFTGKEEELVTTTQDTWQKCERQADLAGADEFSYDDATQQCVVNKADTPCITTLDVVNTVREKSVFGESRPDATGTDLRAWIGQRTFASTGTNLGAAEVLEDVVTAPQVLESDFVCKPSLQCKTRDVHGRCISLTKNALSDCHAVPTLIPRSFHPCASGCLGDTGAESDNDLVNAIRGSINQCSCSPSCSFTGMNDFNIGASVDAFLEEKRTKCALHIDAGSCGLDGDCIGQPSNVQRHAANPRNEGTPTDDVCDYCVAGACPTSCNFLNQGEQGPNRPMPEYTLPLLNQDQKDFHFKYSETQESLLGQEYASTFYRFWLSLPWNRDRFMAAAGRVNGNEGERPFYASAIWSGPGGKDWDSLLSYDKRWLGGAAAVGPSTVNWNDGLTGLRRSGVPSPARSLTKDLSFTSTTIRPGFIVSGSVGASGIFNAYFHDNVTPMWSPLRAWLLGVRDPFLDGDEPQLQNVKKRASGITDTFLDRIVAFRGRVPDTNRGAVLLEGGDNFFVNRENAANDCLAECDNNNECVAVSLRSALMATDDEPLNFVNTGGGLGVQGSTYFRPQQCSSGFQPHLSSFQYNIMKLCPTTMFQTMRVLVRSFPDQSTTAQADFKNIFQSVFSGGLQSSPHSGQAMSGQDNPEDFYTGTGFINPFFYDKTTTNWPHQDPRQIDDKAPNYGQEWVHSMMGSLGADCRTQTTGPSSYKGQSKTLGDQQCHLRLGLHHCEFCWKSQPTGDGRLGTADLSTPTRKTVSRLASKIKCRMWKHAPLTSLGADPTGSTINAFDGDIGGNSRGALKTLDLNDHNGDVPSDMMKLGKARLQRPTPVRFKYTTIYLPKEEDKINVDAVTTGAKTTTATRYTRRVKSPTHTVHRSHDSSRVNQKPTHDDIVVPNDNAGVTAVLSTASQVLQGLGAGDSNFWVQRSTVCNYRQHDRPVFTSVRCPQDMAMTCALPWPVYAENIMTNTSNNLSPTDYRRGGDKCVPVVAVCLNATWRYAGVEGESLCSAAGRLLEIQLGREAGTTQNIDLGTPPHVSGGSYSWPVSWLQPDIAPTSQPPDSVPFRTRRPEPATNTVFAACPERKPCDQQPCPTGMGLGWTPAGVPFCTRVGSGSRGFQQATRDVPKSVHAARQSFGGFLPNVGAVSGTGPALYNGTAACGDNGCGGIINSHCDFNHVSDKQFPSCQSVERVTQACCSAQARLDVVDMTQDELALLTAPKTLASVVQPRATCEATLGLACGNAEFAKRLAQDTRCTCEENSCTADTQTKVRSASMPELDTDTSVVVTQGHRCGQRVRWAPQYLNMGSGAARCNGVDDLTKGGAPVDATGAQLCGCHRREQAPDDDLRWPGVCESPRGCAVHGIFQPSGDASDSATCDGDVVLDGDAATITSQFGDDVANWCSHECLHRGATCWAFDSDASTLTCVMHVVRAKTGCAGTPRFERQRAVYTPSITNQDAGNVAELAAVPAPAPKPDECADQCVATPGCIAWSHDSDNEICHLASAVRRYVLRVGTLNFTVIEDPNAERQILYNADLEAFLQSSGINTSEPLNGTLVAQLLDENSTFVSNHTEVINFATQENEDILGNATVEIDLSCDRDLGVLDTSDLRECARQCDAGHDSHGCTGFTVSVNGTCTMCAGGGEFVAEQVDPVAGTSNATFHTIASGEKQVAHRELVACQRECESAVTCGHCAIVRSTVAAEPPRYVEIGADREIANMPRRDVYPWITGGHTKWDTQCCTQAPCGQSHGPSAFGMRVCPGPAPDAALAGPHAMSVLDTETMQCVTQCESGFANPPACDECAQDNFDPATNCTQCFDLFAVASDGACSLCKNPKNDITKQCTKCLPGFRVSQGGACLEWMCTSVPTFVDSGLQHSVTESTDVVLEVGTGKRLATGAFVGVPFGRVPASLRSTLVRHGGNLYLMGRRQRFLVDSNAVKIDAAIVDITGDDSDWLDLLPMNANEPQPLTRAALMRPDGPLGNLRCGATKITIDSKSIDACTTRSGGTLCTSNDAGSASAELCAQQCNSNPETCVSYVHQAAEQDVFAPSVFNSANPTSTLGKSCQLYTAEQAANLERPRNIMVDRGTCTGAGTRVPADGLVAYRTAAGDKRLDQIEHLMQFRVVRSVDPVGNAAGCWILSRWHRHKIVAVDAASATAAELPCLADADTVDRVTTQWLDQHAPMQGDDVVGTQLSGFMPRAVTRYILTGGVALNETADSVPRCVALCGNAFATQWDASSLQCTCFVDDAAVRIDTSPGQHAGVVITGRRPRGAPVDGRGPVPANCTALAATQAANASQCDDATTDNDGFVLGVAAGGAPECRGLVCTGAASLGPASTTSNEIVRLRKHKVVRPLVSDVLAFSDDTGIDAPLNETQQLNAGACCAVCDTKPGANSYRFELANGRCRCYDARTRTCAPAFDLDASNGACRYCTKDGGTDAVCRLVAASLCAGVLEVKDTTPLCDNDNSFVTYSGAGVSQGCGPGSSTNAEPGVGCDRAAGCVLVPVAQSLTNFTCVHKDTLNTDTREWNKPPHAVVVDGANSVPDKDAVCRAAGYTGGLCSADTVQAQRDRLVSCDCALDANNAAVSGCANFACPSAADTQALWCCDDPSLSAAPCGQSATASAVVADITTVFQPHSSSTAVAQLGHSNVCSATASFAQKFTLVRCAPNQCSDLGSVVQNALFVASSQDNVLKRVPGDACETCGLCQHAVSYRSGLFMERTAVLATGSSAFAGSEACPAHIPHLVAATGACALTTWGGPPLCCPTGTGNCTGAAAKAEACNVQPELRCRDLDDPCEYETFEKTECKDMAPIVLRNIASEDACREQCDISLSSPCLLYEYVATRQLCLLGTVDSDAMRDCADPVTGPVLHHERNDIAVLRVKKQPPDKVCNSAQLRHYAQPTHLGGAAAASNVVLSSVAREHAALYSLPPLTKILRLYGSFARQYRAQVLVQWQKPYDVLCGLGAVIGQSQNCPGSLDAVVGHATAHPLPTTEANQAESLVFEAAVAPASNQENVAVVTSAAIMTHPGDAGSNACIQQAELSVEASVGLGAVAERHADAAGDAWVDGQNAVFLSEAQTQRECLESCMDRVPACAAFAHGSLDPLDVAPCQLYVGPRPVPRRDQANSTVYVTDVTKTCTSPDQCMEITQSRNNKVLAEQRETFKQALQRCLSETTSSNGQPKLMGRATYVNIVRCPPQAPRPTPWHLEFHDDEAGVLCWTDAVASPGVGADRHARYPFTGQRPVEPQDETVPPTPDPSVTFSAPVEINGTATAVESKQGCNFIVSHNMTVVDATGLSKSFQDLQGIVDCGERKIAENCDNDAVCVFKDNTCQYDCNINNCANTLLCRAVLEDNSAPTKCFFLPTGSGPGTMQAPSALQPCGVNGVEQMLRPKIGSKVFIKQDCCVGLSTT